MRIDRIAMVGTILALAAPAGAAAQDTGPTPAQNAAKTCKALRAAMGVTNFKAAYSARTAKSAHGRCVSRQTRVERDDAENAARQCRAEREDPNFPSEHGGQTFDQFYGTNENDRNAFGKCVSGKRKALHAQETENKVEAAKACRAQQRDLGRAHFRSEWGGKRNAFGKCVSATAEAKND